MTTAFEEYKDLQMYYGLDGEPDLGDIIEKMDVATFNDDELGESLVSFECPFSAVAACPYAILEVYRTEHDLDMVHAAAGAHIMTSHIGRLES